MCLFVSKCVCGQRKKKKNNKSTRIHKDVFPLVFASLLLLLTSIERKTGGEREGEADRRLANVILLLDIFSFFFSSVCFIFNIPSC